MWCCSSLGPARWPPPTVLGDAVPRRALLWLTYISLRLVVALCCMQMFPEEDYSTVVETLPFDINCFRVGIEEIKKSCLD